MYNIRTVSPQFTTAKEGQNLFQQLLQTSPESRKKLEEAGGSRNKQKETERSWKKQKKVEGREKEGCKLFQNLTVLFQLLEINEWKRGATRSCLDRFTKCLKALDFKCASRSLVRQVFSIDGFFLVLHLSSFLAMKKVTPEMCHEDHFFFLCFLK